MAKRRYPAPQERARIIARREQLSRQLVEYIATRSPDEQEARAQLGPIVGEHGFDEVYRMLRKIRPRLDAADDPDEEGRQRYAEYVSSYQHFGGERRFLSPEAFASLSRERALLLGRQILREEQLAEVDQRRLDELTDLLLADAFLWDDLVPETPPRLRTDAPSPTTRSVGRNEPCPCRSGKKYKHCHGR
jgi:hypothetical protein